jgi:hypothetical protein
MSFVIKLQAPFERLKLANERPEVALCRAIILQAIVDASSAEQSEDSCMKDATSWLFTDSQHLDEICMGAELEVNFVRGIAKKMIAFNRRKQNCSKNRHSL